MNLKAAAGRILLLVDTEQKNYHTFSFGLTIRRERKYNDFDRKNTEQVLGTIIDADGIPKGALALFHHNCLHAVNEIFNHGQLSGDDIASGIKVISVREEEVYLWKMPDEAEWKPAKNFCIAERVFIPYKGLIFGIEHTKINDVLYLKTGDLAGKVVRTLKACDFPIIFRNEQGVDETIIRCRHSEDDTFDREEIICIDHDLTEKLYAGELLIGIEPKDAKKLN